MTLNSGAWDAAHVQGIAVDAKDGRVYVSLDSHLEALEDGVRTLDVDMMDVLRPSTWSTSSAGSTAPTPRAIANMAAVGSG